MAQPPLSRQIQQLEEELGSILFARGSRPTQLTEQGRLFYEQAMQVLERIDDMQSVMRRMQHVSRNRFSMGFVASTLYGRLPDIIRAYRAARPGVELILLELTTIEQMAALKEGRIDVGFGRLPIDDPAITRVLLRNETLIAALPLTHPALRRKTPLGLADLTDETLIIYPKAPRPSYADQVLSLFRERGLKPAALHEVRELQTALGLVAAEVGVCVVPAAVERFRRDNVGYRALDEVGAVSPIFMSTRSGDISGEIGLITGIIQDIYRKNRIVFGR
jgi:DNA-binding transcriptional LysR family regulator